MTSYTIKSKNFITLNCINGKSITLTTGNNNLSEEQFKVINEAELNSLVSLGTISIKKVSNKEVKEKNINDFEGQETPSNKIKKIKK